MSFRKPVNRNPHVAAGLVLLVLANIGRLFLYRSLPLGAALTDGTIGLLYGASIALLLLGLRSNSRRRCSTDAEPGA